MVGVGVGMGVPVGSNEAIVVPLPSVTVALPALKFVALVLMMSTFEVVPGAIAELMGENENPITFPPGELRSAESGGTVPSMKRPPDK